MWKVLIADDEPKIRRGLRASIGRIRQDMSVVAEAEDGETALAAVEREKPDILMIDIRMPFLNGLELIERINKIRQDCVIIVVTGHDEFEYAKRALQLKVFEYVLKPVPREVLASVLSRAEEELSSRRRQSEYLGWAREQLERNMPLLREEFLRDWVNGRLSMSEIKLQAAFLDVDAAGPKAMAVIHVVDHGQAGGTAGEKDRRLALLSVRGVVEEVLGNLRPFSVFLDENDNVTAIADPGTGSAWVDAVAWIESRVTQSLAHGIIVAEKRVSNGADGVPDAYEELTAEIAQKSNYRSFVVLAQGYIDSHFREQDLTLEEVASAVEISPGYLSRLLKQETGFSFVDYLTRVRVTKAVLLMNDPAMKVYEAAEAVGYKSQHYFSRAFKRVLGRSPVEYRKGGA